MVSLARAHHLPPLTLYLALLNMSLTRVYSVPYGRAADCGFVSWSGRYRVVTTWMGDCPWTVKPSQYITSHWDQLSLSSVHG